MNRNTQLDHSDHEPSTSRFPLSIVADSLGSPLNVGSLFRVCDAMAIDKLYLCGNTATPPNTKIKKTSRSTEKFVNYEWHDNAECLLAGLQASGVFIIALEITASSLPIDSAEFTRAIKGKAPLCLVLGSENRGVSSELLALADITVHIPMYGNNSSMNVIAAASIACFEITRNLL